MEKEENEEKNQYMSLLRQINSKPVIMEKIFAYSLSRPNILLVLISRDKELVKKLNSIFNKVSKTSSGLDKEFINNLLKYSKIRELNNFIEKTYKKIQTQNITYNSLKDKYKFSFINYLFDKIKKLLKYNFEMIDEDMIKGLIYGFYSTLDNAVLTFLPQKNQYLDGNYISITARQIMHSDEKYKNRQRIKLIILFDENYFFNNIYYTIKFKNIEEIEIIFKPQFEELYTKNNHLLHIYLNNYLSKIDHLDCISKINFHNILCENELYQSILGYLFDNYFSEKNEDILQQLRLMTNLKSINIEMTFLYIYEKIKLYYYIYEIFPSLNIFTSNKKFISEVSFSYNLNNKILIINNNNVPLNSQKLLNFIDFMMNNNDIEFIFIINHNKLIIEDEKKEDEKENKTINISKLREFTFINEKNDDIKNLMNKFTFNKDENYRVYEGYDKDKNLIYYRVGETQIQSFDLIDLFKFNKNIENIDFIKEEIIAKFNNDKNNLEIIYNGKKKNDLITDKINFFAIKNFSKFIKYQNNLTELTINRFDVDLNDIVNDNIKTLNINYEKNLKTLEYFSSDTNEKINSFKNLVNINIGSKDSHQVSKILRTKEMTSIFKGANLIFASNPDINTISKLTKKFKKNKKLLNIDILQTNNEQEEIEKEFENEEEEDEYDYEDDNFNKISDYL
jgi:hypothetical protein